MMHNMVGIEKTVFTFNLFCFRNIWSQKQAPTCSYLYWNIWRKQFLPFFLPFVLFSENCFYLLFLRQTPNFSPSWSNARSPQKQILAGRALPTSQLKLSARAGPRAVLLP
jgi:hypothetical protein